MKAVRSRHRILWQYFFWTYLVVLLNSCGFFLHVDFSGILTPLFALAVYLIYSLFYMFPIVLLVLILNKFLYLKFMERFLKRIHIRGAWFVYILAVVGFSLIQILIYADKTILQIYGYHFNGFVWNLVFTPGGLECLGGGKSTMLTYAALILGFVTVQTLLLSMVINLKFIRRAASSIITRPVKIALVVLIINFTIFQGITYGVCNFRGYTPVLSASRDFPLYLPLTFNSLAQKLGFQPVRDKSLKIKFNDSSELSYPLKPLTRSAHHQPYNIVWLVAESFRADMLDPEITPASWRFAQKSLMFTNHYSGGNGTRMGIFSMFYGLYGNYWFQFLSEQRGPLLIDLLLEDNYQMKMFTSARFTYPEFDKTVFARIPRSQLQEFYTGYGWQRDRKNVTDLLNFIDSRDTSRPFMSFMFFESPHARYYFPPESVIRKPYLEDFNYASMNLQEDISLIKNRYINACHHLDSQLQRVIEYLEHNNLLDSTIVIITGDHGEEFMENGHWGHNSAFTQQQIRTPLILSIPGQPPRVIDRMTSHLDIPATLLSLLGVTNPPEDYSLGWNLCGLHKREFTILADWHCLAYVDDHYKAVFPLKGYGFSQEVITTNLDQPLSDKNTFNQTHKNSLLAVMQRMARFNEK